MTVDKRSVSILPFSVEDLIYLAEIILEGSTDVALA